MRGKRPAGVSMKPVTNGWSSLGRPVRAFLAGLGQQEGAGVPAAGKEDKGGCPRVPDGRLVQRARSCSVLIGQRDTF